ISSTQNIPHNFGTGHPWSMMMPLYNAMALSNGVPMGGGSAADPSDLYETWWNIPSPTTYLYPNIPTKFDNTVKLNKVELIRYSKNAYMLQGVKVYKVNGDYSDNGTDTSGLY